MGKIKILVLCAVVFSFLIGCSSSKVNYSQEAIASLHELVNGKNFEIESGWAYPLPTNALNSIANSGLFRPGDNVNQINLIGNTNFLKIQGDSIKAQLPYYGEQRIAGRYNTTNSGIVLDGLLRELEIDFDKSKNSYELRFEANQDSESYQVILNVFPNLKVYMNINSSHRTNIRYLGEIRELDETS